MKRKKMGYSISDIQGKFLDREEAVKFVAAELGVTEDEADKLITEGTVSGELPVYIEDPLGKNIKVDLTEIDPEGSA